MSIPSNWPLMFGGPASRIRPLASHSSETNPEAEQIEAAPPALPKPLAFDFLPGDLIDEEPKTPQDRISRWQRKLLDLSLRNRLLNFRDTKQTIPFVCPDVSSLEDARQTDLIKLAWTDSGKVYGYRKLHDDLLDQGEVCSENRVARLASLAGIAAQIGYKRRPGRYGSKPAVIADNTLDRQFEVTAPDTVWVTDITYIRTHEGWSYLAVVIDLFSRRVIGWSMQSRMTTELALQALLSAVWRREPKNRVMIHSDQGSQFTGKEWQSFLSKHNLDASMSRRGNCHDNAAAESFFHLLKRERIRRRTYTTREAARLDVFDYIEMFYNPTRKHTNNGMLSPVDHETQQRKMNEAGV